MFDSTIEEYDVYKVETIGDSYMVVSGLPECNGVMHAAEIALMSLKLLMSVGTFKIPHLTETTLDLRVGIHSGQYMYMPIPMNLCTWLYLAYPSATGSGESVCLGCSFMLEHKLE